MYSQKLIYGGNRPVIYQQPIIIQNMPPSNLRMPYQQPVNLAPAPIQSIEGFLVDQEYEADKGDPVVIQEAVFKGEVVKVGDKKKQVVSQTQAILVGDGYASYDGKNWKQVSKIILNIFRLGQLEIRDITKLKARYETSLPHYKILKVSIGDNNYHFAFNDKSFNEWFLRVVWAKLLIDKRQCSDYGGWQQEVSGKLYKKSFVMGDWEPKMVIIDSRSLRVHKDNSSSPSLQIMGAKQIWTRFEEIRGGFYLVVKLWNGIMKEEFAVPTAFCINWLHHFLGLLIVK